MTIQANFPAIKPSLLLDFANTKQLDSRITYTRASTATFYNGVTTAKAEENQLTYSNEISTARWVSAGISTTINNSTSPDGTTTATLLTASANADARLRITTTQAVSTAHTFSVYAKAGATSWLRLRNLGSNDCSGWFNLTTGAVGTVSGGTSAITSVGSGWYRCSITSTSAASIANNLLDMGAPSGDNTAASAGGETISVWGVQLEARSSVSALTATTTQAITNYIPVLQTAASGVARFDNNPTTGESLGLLIEESRTNLLTYSEDASNAAWTKLDTTVVTNTIVAPDGTLTGDKLVENTSNTVHAFYQSSSFTASTTYTASFYLKASGRTLADVAFQTTLLSGGSASFDLSAGTVTSQGANATARITAVGNGWYRCSTTVTAANTVSAQVQIILRDAGGNSSYTGNGFSGVFLWGAQLEAGAFATSYIPTVASQVTRAADAASMTGTNFSTWYNQGEGTIYADYSNQVTTASINFGVLTIKDSGSDNAIGMLSGFTSGFTNFVPRVNATVQANLATSSNSPVNNKLAGSYAVDNFAAANNGTLLGTDTSGTIPVVDRMVIGSNRFVNPAGQITIKKIAYYPVKSTSTQLQALTS
jgi:hypothetical protein